MSPKRRLCSGECLARNISIDCFAGYQRIKGALQQYFKYNTFRPVQLEALLPLIHGNDVFVRMCTGGGKSLCMFLLPLTTSENAIGIIVSPLVSLMDQQVSHSMSGTCTLKGVDSSGGLGRDFSPLPFLA